MGCSCTHAAATSVRESSETATRLETGREDNLVPRRSTSRSFHRLYLLEGRIGEGSFARVYGCKKIGDEPETDYAVKIIDLRKRLSGELLAEQEISILKRIGSQEHCCRLIDSMSNRRFHYIVLERCRLTLLRQLENMPELTEWNLASLVRQMFLGLASVHAVGIVHRDVKPDNFLLSEPGGTVKLCDFGLAEALDPDTGETKGLYGTAPYMSPEMIVCSPYGRPTDVWSLGVILYVLVIGQFPYIPERPCVKLMKAAIAQGTPEPSFRYDCSQPSGAEMSPQLLALLKALLCRDSAMRPSATEAMEHGWFGLDEGHAPELHHRCLKDTLQSAKKVGAFDVRSRANESLDSMDEALQELQKKYRALDGEGQDKSGAEARSSFSPATSSDSKNSKATPPHGVLVVV